MIMRTSFVVGRRCMTVAFYRNATVNIFICEDLGCNADRRKCTDRCFISGCERDIGCAVFKTWVQCLILLLLIVENDIHYPESDCAYGCFDQWIMVEVTFCDCRGYDIKGHADFFRLVYIFQAINYFLLFIYFYYLFYVLFSDSLVYF
jgi:hypothetical protein